MEGQKLKRNVVEPTTVHNTTFILLHDRGSSGAELQHALCIALLPTLVSQVAPGARFIFPDGPFLDPKGGRDWYALEYPQLECGEAASLDQWAHVIYAAEQVDMVVEDEAQLISRKNIFLGGVGKGCAVAMMTLLEMERPLGGLIGFGGWMPFVRDMKDVATLGMIQTPDPPFSQNSQHNQGGIGGIALGQGNGLIDPRLLSIQNGQQQQSFPQAVSPTPLLAQPDQSMEARHQRVAHFLRQFEWTEEARFKYEREFSTATPIVLMHSPNDELVSRSHAKEAQMMLMQLGFHVKLEESNTGHAITRGVLDELLLALLEVLPFSSDALRFDLMNFMMGSTM
ncbi:Abhydrolase-2 domain-containing protein [Fusarium keratoplasticum]|uniref:Abhydrolase-2 domain-containing protein n=1 Tax=Fusarium keratoplasticum TaxID=1328300 RepID=A0ACC0RDK3_9HYPO|nr:Abhydrolase-2 domain-containing protein [Fusarium keratoplasticum]KAI8684313.1 Abhydrolase-2 domain-containing protein [Fusarium keratoplasticum]KAI8688426.1 Abhydrolase-2 domain-containing protein [Fusarium keratoplasticum]